jgi:uncharacterized repeat protein (TIGR03803 family)
MHICQTLFRDALLGSTLAVAALTPAAGASLSRADWDRIRAATGNHSSAVQSGAASGFTAARPPATYTVLHDFAGPPSDGAGSGAEVTLDSAGNIYGTTDYGGAYGTNGYGTIFKIATGGAETLLHSFGGTGDGTTPDGAVTITSAGNMYGTTIGGGSSGNGVIWKLAAGGTYTVLHNFTADESNFARGRLIQDRKGNFYGSDLFGGAAGDGTVFKFNARGKVSVLHTFSGTADGEFPEHGVVSDKAGNLYGVTAFGGADDNGTIYEIAKDGTFTTLYTFTGGADGGFPYGGLAIDRDGNLYGSADDGGSDGVGTVFELAPGGTLTTLYNFTDGTDGANPQGDMLRVGKGLYSAAASGGDPTCRCGGIYEITAKGKEKMLQAFTPTTGNVYSAGLTPSNGVFYGTTQYGGNNDNGVVFSLTKK